MFLNRAAIKSHHVGRVLGWLIAVGIGSFVFMPICHLHFDCGCGWPGLGGHAHCDVLQSGPPDCPWCYHSWLGYTVMIFSAALALMVIVIAPPRWSVFKVTLLATAAMIVGLVMSGIVTSVWLGQPILAGL